MLGRVPGLDVIGAGTHRSPCSGLHILGGFVDRRTSPHCRPVLCKPPLLVGCLGAGQSGGIFSDIQGSAMKYKRSLDKL